MIKEQLKKIIPWMNAEYKIQSLYKKANNALKNGNKQLANYYSYKISNKYGCYISPKAVIGKNLTLPHPIGIVIGEGAKIGNNVIIYQNVTIGRKNRNVPKYPIIEDNVIIYCQSTIIGDITIGKNSIIGSNSVVLENVPEDCTAVGIPAKIIRKEN